MEIIQISNNKRLVKSRNQDDTLPPLTMMLCMCVTDMELHSWHVRVLGAVQGQVTEVYLEMEKSTGRIRCFMESEGELDKQGLRRTVVWTDLKTAGVWTQGQHCLSICHVRLSFLMPDSLSSCRPYSGGKGLGHRQESTWSCLSSKSRSPKQAVKWPL